MTPYEDYSVDELRETFRKIFFLSDLTDADLEEMDQILAILREKDPLPPGRSVEELWEEFQTVYMNKELGLKSVTRKAKRRHCNGPEPYGLFENLLEQDFHADRRNAKWCVDFTYLSFGKNNRRYNCTIIDLYDRRVVASVNSSRINTQLAIDTLEEAIRNADGETGMILHSDRGSQFASKEFIEFCKGLGITQSMSKPGCPYDNAPMERYFNTLKAELLHLKKFETEKELYTAITAYAYGWYNNLRPHSYNGGLPPKKVA